MKRVFSYLRDRLRSLLLIAMCAAIGLGCFALFRLPLGAVLYAYALCAVALAAAGVADFLRWNRKNRCLEGLEQEILLSLSHLPEPESAPETRYQSLLTTLFQALATQEAKDCRRFDQMAEYFTLWAHQIKTPVAAMQLMLQSEETPDPRALNHELFQIQQYVEMALGYLRLDSPTTDFVIQSYPLDPILRQALRKFGPSFIRKHLTLNYTPIELAVVTDEKWLLFALEQVLSNAVKYTQTGGVTIYLEAPCTLVISDTGQGIAPEDLPRIFERGYTGRMGRVDKRATGIGLYLCRRTLTQLGHSVTAQSVPGEGTDIRIDLRRREIPRE